MSRWLLIATLGCGHAATPPGPAPGATRAPLDAAVPRDAPALDDDLPRLAARSLRLYQDLAQAVGGSGCAEVAAKVDALATAYGDVIAANARVLHAGHERIAALKLALEPRQADFDAAAKAIADAPVLAQCAQDAAFAKAMDRLVGEP